jgi:hypothetical protein
MYSNWGYFFFTVFKLWSKKEIKGNVLKFVSSGIISYESYLIYKSTRPFTTSIQYDQFSDKRECCVRFIVTTLINNLPKI